MSDIEKDIKAVGADKAPRVTPDDLKANIVSEHYFTAADGCVTHRAANLLHGTEDTHAPDRQALELLTFCVLVLRNGFTVTGESACASPENFNAEIGRKAARENAVQKMWPLMGYALKEQLFQRTQPAQTPEVHMPRMLQTDILADTATMQMLAVVLWADDTTTTGAGVTAEDAYTAAYKTKATEIGAKNV